MYDFDEEYFFSTFNSLLSIDSTTGMHTEIEEYIEKELDKLGYPHKRFNIGGVISEFGKGKDPVVITAHLDDIGLMVRKINPDGTLRVVSIGGLYPFYSVTENVRIYTRDGKVYSGTVCRTPSSIHVTEDELRKNIGDFATNVCIVIDEDTNSAEETRALGIETGDMIALEPRPRYVNGYIKSRFIDDKACVATLLTAMKYLKENGIVPERKIYAYFAVYEEIGHGTSVLPDDVKDVLAIDIAPTGPDQTSSEKKVSIFAKDSRFPYHYEMACEIREIAKKKGIPFVMDVFTPHYGSDGDTSVVAGHDVRHGAIGPGTANSHGYERTHIDGIKATYDLTVAYMTES